MEENRCDVPALANGHQLTDLGMILLHVQPLNMEQHKVVDTLTKIIYDRKSVRSFIAITQPSPGQKAQASIRQRYVRAHLEIQEVPSVPEGARISDKVDS